MSTPRRKGRHWRHGPLALIAAVALGACEAGPLDPSAEYVAAVRAVNSWIAAHPSEWRMDRHLARPLQRASWSQPCEADPPAGRTALRTNEAGLDMLLFFDCPERGALDINALPGAFAFAVLDDAPHRISSPGWRHVLVTPSSSFSESVTISIPAAGRLLIRIDTPLYAVYGHSTRAACQPPADAPSREGCYLQREHRIPLRIDVSVPAGASKF